MNIIKSSYIKGIYYFLGKKKLTPVHRISNDVYLVSYPKSGNTWFRFLIANILVNKMDTEFKLDYNNLELIIPDIHLNRKIPRKLLYHPFPRVIKSHDSYNKYYPNVLLIMRDPKDVMVSYFKYNTKGTNLFQGDFSEFIRSKKFGLPAWIYHTKSWLGNVDMLVRYEDLKVDINTEVKKVLNYLEIEITESLLSDAINRSSFDNMKKLNKNSKKVVSDKKNYEFFRKGMVGDWQNYFSESDLNYYNSLREENFVIFKRLNY